MANGKAGKAGFIVYYDRMRRRIAFLTPEQLQLYILHLTDYAQYLEPKILEVDDPQVAMILQEDKVLIDTASENYKAKCESIAKARNAKKKALAK